MAPSHGEGRPLRSWRRVFDKLLHSARVCVFSIFTDSSKSLNIRLWLHDFPPQASSRLWNKIQTPQPIPGLHDLDPHMC